jgi:prepilin-type N-terminal cleavage/methylation domain-containing protein
MKRSRIITLRAFTLVELLVVLGVIALMVAFVLPGMARAKQKAMRIQCTNNLKQLGLASRTWVIGGMATLSTNRLAGLGRITSGEAFRYFQVVSNELGNPKILVCPADTRVPAKDLGPGFSNANLSYFVGLDAEETYPSMFLYGDRNLTNGLPIQEGILYLPPNRPVGFTHELHNCQGNIALADGSVQGFTSGRLSSATGMTNRLAMP